MDDDYTAHVLLLLLLLAAFGRRRFLVGAPLPALLKFLVVIVLFNQISCLEWFQETLFSY